MKGNNRVLVSIAFAIMGVSLAMCASTLIDADVTGQANGTVIDFGDYGTVWTDADLKGFDTTLSLLMFAADSNGYELELGDDGRIVSIDGISEGTGSWDLWVVHPGGTEWERVDAPYDQDPSDYTITSWSYRSDGGYPTIAVDYSGNPVYGYSKLYRIVSLSPTVTEILGSLKATDVLVGVDHYSNYPADVIDSKANGDLTVVGTYTSPSFELITGTNPDMVICDGSQRSHYLMAERLREVGINAVVTYPGEDLDQVLDNIYLVGRAIGYDIAARNVIEDTRYVLDTLNDATKDSSSMDTMIALDPSISPWVSGEDTYMNGILTEMGGENVFSDWSGWVHITSDRIPYANPEAIIIVTSEYSATQDEYDYLYSHLSAQWKLTDAWKEGNVYVICESAAEMASRCGPRIAQTAELVTMMLHPECFDHEVPKIVGDDYTDYLHYSKDLSYNS